MSNHRIETQVIRAEKTTSLVSGGPECETITVWKGIAGWIITREGMDLNAHATRAKGENEALKLLGIDPKDPAIVRITEY